MAYDYLTRRYHDLDLTLEQIEEMKIEHARRAINREMRQKGNLLRAWRAFISWIS